MEAVFAESNLMNAVKTLFPTSLSEVAGPILIFVKVQNLFFKFRYQKVTFTLPDHYHISC